MRCKTLFIFVCIFLISITGFVFCAQNLKSKDYIVPGTVFSKNIEQYAHGKPRNMSTRYIICVKPNDISKFKHYSLYVDYTTYCTHNIGDKITFSVSEKKCLRDFKRSALVEEIFGIMLILFGVLSIVSFACITIIVEPYCDGL